MVIGGLAITLLMNFARPLAGFESDQRRKG